MILEADVLRYGYPFHDMGIFREIFPAAEMRSEVMESPSFTKILSQWYQPELVATWVLIEDDQGSTIEAGSPLGQADWL